ncbi:hypothetical protein EI42_06419 [Thermosporothrix hazakensis]|jgi:hypothetical protein|uniref:Uncharacterized protein n=1 Tax=Thermosporothrix hazakensis TaxID=644383 RepID=A0A326U3D0_THEHA|nr:hypothetical protein EI42_06419 [Thermosporothrix hazakensis]GCE50481.1 hypothetical protein KTH_53500 [Thermosporothrix hazakensis]
MKVLLGYVDIVDIILLIYRQYDYVQVYINAMYNSMKLYFNGKDVCGCNARVLEV